MSTFRLCRGSRLFNEAAVGLVATVGSVDSNEGCLFHECLFVWLLLANCFLRLSFKACFRHFIEHSGVLLSTKLVSSFELQHYQNKATDAGQLLLTRELLFQKVNKLV